MVPVRTRNGLPLSDGPTSSPLGKDLLLLCRLLQRFPSENWKSWADLNYEKTGLTYTLIFEVDSSGSIEIIAKPRSASKCLFVDLPFAICANVSHRHLCYTLPRVVHAIFRCVCVCVCVSLNSMPFLPASCVCAVSAASYLCVCQFADAPFS